MSWTSVHLAHDDEIQSTASQIPGYVHLHLGQEVVLMAPIAKAAELHAVLGEQLATPEQDGGASDA